MKYFLKTSFLITFLFFTQHCLAQGLCNGITNAGGFTTSTDKPCLSGGSAPIILTDNSGGTNVSYVFDYKGETAAQLSGLASNTGAAPSYSYPLPGTYTILQYGSRGGAMYFCKTVTVVEPKDFPVTVSNCSGSAEVLVQIPANNIGYDSYTIVWDANNSQPAQTGLLYSYNYLGSKPNSLMVRGSFSDARGNGCDYPKNVSLTNANIPLISSLESPTATEALLKFQGTTGGNYTLLYREEFGGSWNNAPNPALNVSGADFEAKVTGLAANKNYCFKIQSPSSCAVPIESAEVCGIKLTATAIAGQNDVSWTPYLGVTTYNLTRSDNVNTQRQSINGTTYTDNNLACGQVCYQILVVAGFTDIYSNRVCLNSAGLAAPLDNLHLDISHSTKAITVEARDIPNITEYIFLRADAPNATFQQVGSKNTARFTDINVNIDTQPYCYKMLYKDQCGTLSRESDIICSMHLSTNKNSDITWTPYANPLGVISYQIVYTDDSGMGNTESLANANNLTFDIANLLLTKNIFNSNIYIIAKTNISPLTGNTTESKSNIIPFKLPPRIFIPTAFAPNGTNKTFEVKGTVSQIATFQMLIYNSWGEVIFESTDPNIGWDGTVQGQNAPTDTYAYKLVMTDLNGKQTEKLGTVLLIR